MRVAVIGCGIFGAVAAMRLSEAGHQVVVLERNAGPLEGASYHNQNRLHLGYHYPRDPETAEQCVRGFLRFLTEFSSCIAPMGDSAYFVASEGSRTSAAAYLAFADRLGMASLGCKPRRLDPGSFCPAVRGVEAGIAVPELVYDCAALRALVRRRLAQVPQRYETEAFAVARAGQGFTLGLRRRGEISLLEVDAVLDCTYAETGRLAAQLGHAPAAHQYEATALAVLAWDEAPVGITIMDGPFCTVLPFGSTGRFLLYHVEHSVLAREVGTALPAAWRDPSTAPAPGPDFFERLRAACCTFVPGLAAARQVGLLSGPRVVLADREATDGRPSILSAPEPRFLQVFAGKIDHCMWAAHEAVEMLRRA